MFDCFIFLCFDDWYIYLCDGVVLVNIVGDVVCIFGCVIVMLNLVLLVCNVVEVDVYWQCIFVVCFVVSCFELLMVLYFIDCISVEEICIVKVSGFVYVVKFYLVGVIINLDFGVICIDNIFEVFEVMVEVGMLLLVYGEVICVEVDVFDCEKQFIDEYLCWVVECFLILKVVFEYIIIGDVVQFVWEVLVNVGVIIIVYYLLYNCNYMLVGGICLYFYCLLIFKCNIYQEVLLDVVVSGNLKFFFGIDLVLYVCYVKEVVCGCVGCYSVYVVIELYVEVFEQCNVLDKLEGFVSLYGLDFYGLLCNID